MTSVPLRDDGTSELHLIVAHVGPIKPDKCQSLQTQFLSRRMRYASDLRSQFLAFTFKVTAL